MAGYVRMVLKRIYKRQGVSGQVALVPQVLAIDALALPETFFTVWTNVFDRARLAEGESILVHGGSSGIGPRVERSNVLSIMLKRLTVTGSTLRPRSVEQKAAGAHRLMASSEHVGKIVLEVCRS